MQAAEANHIQDHLKIKTNSTQKIGAHTEAPLLCESILMNAASRGYAAKQDVFHEGDVKSSVYQVEAGAVCLYKTTPDGRRQIFGFAFPGDFIGLGASDAYSCSAQTVSPVLLRSLPVSRLHQLAAQDPNIALGLYRTMSRELEATRDLLLSLGQRGSLERVAVFLLTLSERNERVGKNPLLITLPMTRSDVADFLGMTIETVSRSLTKLRDRNIITIIRGSLVQIIDMEGMKDLINEPTYH
jgi:CRP/FNR family transcriptional regulator, anaerobic regulatory protein